MINAWENRFPLVPKASRISCQSHLDVISGKQKDTLLNSFWAIIFLLNNERVKVTILSTPGGL